MRNSAFSKAVWHFFRVALSFVLAIAPAGAAAKTASGFVTRIVSPSDFFLGSLDVTLDAKAQCTGEDIDSDIEIQNKTFGVLFSHRVFALHDRFHSDTGIFLRCAAVHLVVGSYVDVVGEGADSDGQMHAIRLTVYRFIVHQRIARLPESEEWESGALIEEEPAIRRTEKGWSGTIWLNGYPMTVSPNTALLTAPAGSELSFRGFGPLLWQFFPRWGTVMPRGSTPAFTGNLFQSNMWATYRSLDPYDERWVGEGRGPARNTLQLMRIRLWPNQVSSREKKYRARLAPLIGSPDFGGQRPGRVGFVGESSEKGAQILGDSRIQHFVSDLGDSLVPAYQMELTDEDSTKLDFRFYVTYGEHPVEDDEMTSIDGLEGLASKRPRGALVAFPSGVVFVPDYILGRVSSEAQLASVLSCAVATILQKQSYISHNSRAAGWQPEYGSNPTQLLFPLFEDEQALRLGIRQMYLAGYDIREAPFAWALAAGKPAVNPVMDSKHPDKEIPWYAAYAFDYISQFYSDVDYSKLKRGRAEYAQFLKELRHADPEAFGQSRK